MQGRYEVELDGHRFSVRRDPRNGAEVAAWPAGWTEEEAPFVVELLSADLERPWVVRGEWSMVPGMGRVRLRVANGRRRTMETALLFAVRTFPDRLLAPPPGVLEWTWDGDEMRATLDGRLIAPGDVDRLEEALARLRQEQEARRRRAASDAAMLAAQRTVSISGRKIVVQRHPQRTYDVAAWPAGHGRDDAPFVVRIDGIGRDRPWIIEGPHLPYGDARRRLSRSRGGPVRYASLEAAVRKGIELLEAGELGENFKRDIWS